MVLALDLIDGLPAASRYRQAVLEDEDVADELLTAEQAREAAGVTDPPWRPSISEFTPEVALLIQAVNALERIASDQVNAASHGKAKSKPRRQEGPETAVDRLRTTRSLEANRDLMSQFLPHNTHN